jgi:hypothetical protein
MSDLELKNVQKQPLMLRYYFEHVETNVSLMDLRVQIKQRMYLR